MGESDLIISSSKLCERARFRTDASLSLLRFLPSLLLLSLVVASNYEPYSIIEKLNKHLAGSANIVVYSPYLQVRSSLRL